MGMHLCFEEYVLFSEEEHVEQEHNDEEKAEESGGKARKYTT